VGPPPSFFRGGGYRLSSGVTARASAPGRRTDSLTHRQSDTPPSHSTQYSDRRPRATPQAAADQDAETVPATQRTPGILILGSFTPHRTHRYTNHRLIHALRIHTCLIMHRLIHAPDIQAFSSSAHSRRIALIHTRIAGSFTPHRNRHES
jgi:hypothetical protein